MLLLSAQSRGDESSFGIKYPRSLREGAKRTGGKKIYNLNFYY